jgi:hypothetical protein
MMMTTISKIQPIDGWWGDADGGISCHIWGEPTPQGTVKISYVVGEIEYWEHVPRSEIMSYTDFLAL